MPCWGACWTRSAEPNTASTDNANGSCWIRQIGVGWGPSSQASQLPQKASLQSDQLPSKKRRSPAGLALGHLLRRPTRHDSPAQVPCSRPDINHPVTLGHHAHFMLHHNHRMPRIHQLVQLAEQTIDVPGVQPGGRLVQHIQGGAPGIALQLGSELDALCLTARQLGGRLPEAQITQADIAQHD